MSSVFILVDGARADVLYTMLSKGLLPNIEKHVANRGVVVKNAVTVFPSTTGPAHAPFLTGAFPGPLDMPGIRWFDRRKNSYQDYGPLAWLQFERDYVGPGAFAMNTDMSGEIKTIFESQRLGDLIINSRMGWDLMPETPPHRGSHGGLHAAEMKVPLLVGNSSYEMKPDQPLRTLDVLDILLAGRDV